MTFVRNRSHTIFLYVWMFGLAWSLAGCATQSPPLTADQLTAVLAAPDRSQADRENDARRKAREMLAFIDARAGMRVLDVGAGGGHSAELLARIVGAGGRVYAHNSPEFMKNLIKDRFAERLSWDSRSRDRLRQDYCAVAPEA